MAIHVKLIAHLPPLIDSIRSDGEEEEAPYNTAKKRSTFILGLLLLSAAAAVGADDKIKSYANDWNDKIFTVVVAKPFPCWQQQWRRRPRSSLYRNRFPWYFMTVR